ncbi:hypothetical protein MOSE0_I07338 [Monosporozyma servazzii]
MPLVLQLNTMMMHFIDGQFQLYSQELQEVTSYLKGYTRNDSVMYGEEYFSLIAKRHADFTEELIDLHAEKQIYISELNDYYKDELKTSNKEKEQLINTINNLKMETKRLSESSNFYKAKAEKYHRHIKNNEKEQLLLQQQQKDQQQEQDICIEELKDALHDQEEDHKAQLDDIKKFSDDIIGMLTVKLEEEKEKALTLQAEVDAAVSSPQLPSSSAPSLTPSPSMLSISSSRYSTRQPSPSPASTPCVSDFSSSRHNTVCTSTPMSSPSHLSRNTFIHPAATIPPLRYSNATPSTPYPPSPQPKLFRPPPPPMPSIARAFITPTVEDDNTESLPVCDTESARRWFNDLMAAGQKTEPVNEDSFLDIRKFANGEYESLGVHNERYNEVEEEVVTHTNKFKSFFKEVVPQLFKSKKEPGGQ